MQTRNYQIVEKKSVFLVIPRIWLVFLNQVEIIIFHQTQNSNKMLNLRLSSYGCHCASLGAIEFLTE